MIRVLVLLLAFAVGAGIGLLAPGYEPPPRPRPPTEGEMSEPAPARRVPAAPPREPEAPPAPAGDEEPDGGGESARTAEENPVISGRIVDEFGRPVSDARILPIPNPIYLCGRATRHRKWRYDTGEGEVREDGTFVFRCRDPVGPFRDPSGVPALFQVSAQGYPTASWRPAPHDLEALETGRPLGGVEIVLDR